MPELGGRPTAAEFFAGIGLVRMALENVGFEVAWANDIDAKKHRLYSANFSDEHFVLGDVSDVTGDSLPTVDLAAASFPCIDLSLAGGRAGLDGHHSGTFWEFVRVIEEMGDRRPPVVVLENVAGFSSSRGGEDLRAAIDALNKLGYCCDVLMLDAKWFVPQSRPRIFLVGSVCCAHDDMAFASVVRPGWLDEFRRLNQDLSMCAPSLPVPPRSGATFDDVVERLGADHTDWWIEEKVRLFIGSLSPVQTTRLAELKDQERKVWRTAFRRTRGGVSVWEMRGDSIAGCLRTARGGSSKQAVVEVEGENVRVRWMTAREYARLQGAPDFKLEGFSRSEAIMGFGDAVCVPAYEWLAREYLLPLVTRCKKSAP